MEQNLINWYELKQSLDDRLFDVEYRKDLDATARENLRQTCLADIDKIMQFHRTLTSDSMLAYNRAGGQTLNHTELIEVCACRQRLLQQDPKMRQFAAAPMKLKDDINLKLPVYGSLGDFLR